MSEASIRSLLEMGITREVAIEALAKTNGNIEASVNYIFSGELPQQDAQVDTVELRSYPQPEENAEFVENAVAAVDSSQSENESTNWPDSNPVPSYEDRLVQHTKNKPDDPIVVQMGSENSIMENYFALFCLAVGFGFPHKFLEPDFKDLVYCKDWYQGHSLKPKFRIKFESNETVAIVPQEELTGQDSLVLQPELLWQFQKLLAIQNVPSCQRKFVSSKFLTKALEPQVVDKLNNCDHLHDVLPSFIKSLATDAELCPGVSSIKELFISTAYYKPPSEPDMVETLVSLLHFMPEEYESNLYKMFNALLFPDDNDSTSDLEDSQNSLGNLAPLITIVFDEMDESTESANLANGVEVPLEFYPQIYTEKAKKLLINDILMKSREAQAEAREALRTLSDLKSYQGKHIHSFLNSTLDFIAKDAKSISQQPEVAALVSSLELLKENLGSRKTTKMAEYKALTQKINNEFNLSHPELGIIEAATRLGIIDEPYLLTTAVISPANYFLRQRNGQWHHVVTRSATGDIDVIPATPKDVLYTIRLHTRTASETPLMFTYFKKSAIDSDEMVKETIQKNGGCFNFARKDQKALEDSAIVVEKEQLMDL
ncbi:LAME_0F10088g1_1 [Lachancea meyersii CBS 8951]|uniref:LAME_0F10088g1_1 n=1 Tax=Lachancea meyersii CBS 8951 TaxID=1266667 RepID=A0A1G4JVA7_9SACH|nr:LAME_0F10088g1_1 [Lachancea meyersii CBS 8951]